MNKERIKHIFIQIKNIIIAPSKEWGLLISSDKFNANHCIKDLVFPLWLLAIIVNLIGYLFYSLIVRSFSVIYALLKTFETGLICIIPFVITLILINKIKKKIKINISLSALFCLLAYSSSLFWSANIIIGFFPGYPTLDSFIVFLSTYGVYIFYIGASKIKVGEPINIVFLTILVFFLYILFYSITKWSISYPLKVYYYYQFFK